MLVYLVRNPDRTVEFYESLGFRIGKREDHQATCYVNWFWLKFVEERRKARSGPEPGATLYLKVDDIDDFYDALLARDFAPSTEPRTQHPGTRELLLDDHGGNPLAFFAK